MDNPVCLIENHEGGKLVVNQEAVQILADMTQPVVIVAIVGRYRTGKSYLMNKLAGYNNGFPLGSTVQSKTKGIWMWCVPHPTKPGHTLVLLDTEGLGDVEKGNSKNDAWIFSLAVLLSSALVYNSVGTIDQQAMEQLHYVTELSEMIQVKANHTNETEDASAEFKRFFPSFTWCVRDFSLDLEKDGKPITADEYLQIGLNLKQGFGKKALEYNLPRQCIRHYFHSHKCFVFDQPAPKAGLQRLDELQDSELEPDFVEQTKEFLSYIYQNSPSKTMPGGHVVTGRLLGNLTISYVEAVESGSIPCMENAVLALAKMENARAVNDALLKYDAMMSKKMGEFPTETQKEFLNLHQDCEKEALGVFMNHSFNDENQEYQRNLIMELAERRSKYSQCNEEASIQKCKAIIQQLNETMEKAISEGEYSKPGGHKQFMKDKEAVVDAYHRNPEKGIKALEVLQEFLMEKDKIEAAILQADQTMTEKEKEILEQKVKAEAEERERQIREENSRRLNQLMEAQKESLQNHEEVLRQQMEEARQKMMEQNEWLMEEKMREREEMLTRGFQDQAEILENQIESLKRQNEQASRLPSLKDIFLALLPHGIVTKFLK
ncbi:guanylate-binding protein 3-like isoform 1-T2 [Discoglossus pictus]